MTIKHMRIFLTVYQEMNITKAAELLHMTQPAITRAIKELEQYYGIRLFERINHRLYKTKSGEDFYAGALHIIKSFDELETDIKSFSETGLLRIGASITLGSFLLPRLIKEFQRLHPGLQIRATISNTETIQNGVLNNLIDIAVIEGTPTSEYISRELLLEDCLKVIVSPSHPLLEKNCVNFKDIAECPLLLRENGSAGRTFLNHVFDVHGYFAEPLWESTSTQALVNGVAADIGISILPEQLVAADIASGKVSSLTITDESFVRKNYIIRHNQKFLSTTIREFTELCHNTAMPDA